MPENPSNPDPADRLGISIVVPVSRSRATVENLIRSVEETIPGDLIGEVQLLMVGAPPAELSASRNPLVRVEEVPLPERHPGIRRNIGLARAEFLVIALLDDDILVTRSWFETIYREYRLNGYSGILTGPSNLPYSRDFPERLSAELTNSPLSPFRSSHRTLTRKPVSAKNVEFCNCVLTRSIWSDLGGFDEIGDWRIDDTLFCWAARRAGVEMKNHPGLKTAHRRGSFPLAYYRWIWYEKFHQAKVFVHYSFVFGPDPYFLALFLLSGAGLGLILLFFLRWLPVAAAVYLALAYVLEARAGISGRLSYFLLIPPLTLISYLAAGGGFYSGLIWGFRTRKSVSPVTRAIREKFRLPGRGNAS